MNKVGRTLLYLQRAVYSCNIVSLNLSPSGDVCHPPSFAVVLSLEINTSPSTRSFENNHEANYPSL
jgi:hypothetical protein